MYVCVLTAEVQDGAALIVCVSSVCMFVCMYVHVLTAEVQDGAAVIGCLPKSIRPLEFDCLKRKRKDLRKTIFVTLVGILGDTRGAVQRSKMAQM
jgi:hypothetical protein